MIRSGVQAELASNIVMHSSQGLIMTALQSNRPTQCNRESLSNMCALMRAAAEAINFYANGHVGWSGEEDRGLAPQNNSTAPRPRHESFNMRLSTSVIACR